MFRVAVVWACIVLFAGCTSPSPPDEANRVSGEGTSASFVPPPAPAASVTSDNGSLAGTVVDDEARPLVAASVSISGRPDLSTRSDEGGQFTLNGLAPAVYTVSVQKDSYEPQSLHVSIVAGEVAKASFRLAALITVVAHAETFVDDGWIQSSAYLGAYGSVNPVGQSDKAQFHHNITAGGQAVVSGMRWDSSTPATARYLRLTFQMDGPSPQPFNSSIGKSPLTTRSPPLAILDDASFGIYMFGTNRCEVLAGPTCFAENPEALLPQVVYEQRASIATTVFYLSAPPVPFDPFTQSLLLK